MRNAFLISFIVFLLVAAGGYSISWFAQARQVRLNIEQTIAKINDTQPYITYDAIETSGFPSTLYVSIVRPHFSGRIDLLLKSLAENPALTIDAATKQRLTSMPEWNQDSLLDGRITLGINALSNKYSLTISGERQHNMALKSQTYHLISQTSGATACTIEMHRHASLFTSMWDFNTLRDHDFVRDFRLLDCNGPAYTLFNQATKEPLMQSSGGRIYITSQPLNDDAHVRFYLKVTDAEITPQGDALVAALTQIINPTNLLPPKYSVYGKQNAEIDFSYNGASDLKDSIRDRLLDIHLDKCDITTQIFAMHAVFQLSNAMENGKRSAKLSFKSTANFNDPYNTLMQDGLRRFIQQLYADQNMAQAPALAAALQKYTPEQMYLQLAPALPNLQSLGTLTQAAGFTYLGNVEMTEGDIGIGGLELSATPYGITGEGSARLTANQMFPAGNFLLNCRNCLPLIDDVMTYNARLQNALQIFNAQQAAAMNIDPRRADGFKQFVSALAVPATADRNTLTFAVVSDGASGVTINGKRMDEVMALYTQYVMPPLPEAKQPETKLPLPKKH